MSHPTETKDTFIMAAADKRHVLEEDEDEEKRKSEKNTLLQHEKVKNTRWTFKQK